MSNKCTCTPEDHCRNTQSLKPRPCPCQKCKERRRLSEETKRHSERTSLAQEAASLARESLRGPVGVTSFGNESANCFFTFIMEVLGILVFFAIATLMFWVSVCYYSVRLVGVVQNSDRNVKLIVVGVAAFLLIAFATSLATSKAGAVYSAKKLHPPLVAVKSCREKLSKVVLPLHAPVKVCPYAKAAEESKFYMVVMAIPRAVASIPRILSNLLKAVLAKLKATLAIPGAVGNRLKAVLNIRLAIPNFLKAKHQCCGNEHSCPDAEHKCSRAEHKCARAEHKCARADHQCPLAEHKLPSVEHKCPRAEHKCPYAEHKFHMRTPKIPKAVPKCVKAAPKIPKAVPKCLQAAQKMPPVKPKCQKAQNPIWKLFKPATKCSKCLKKTPKESKGLFASIWGPSTKLPCKRTPKCSPQRTYSESEGRVIYQNAKRYAIPTEMKQPPTIIVYMRDLVMRILHGAE